MDQTQKLLQEIIKNSRTGADACEQLLVKTEDIGLREELMKEKQIYSDAVRDAEAKMYAMGARPQPLGVTERAGMWMGMQMNTITDKSPSHIADMVIQGATMGIVSLTKARNSFSEADAEAQGIASWLITEQQEAIDRLKVFLQEKVKV